MKRRRIYYIIVDEEPPPAPPKHYTREEIDAAMRELERSLQPLKDFRKKPRSNTK